MKEFNGQTFDRYVPDYKLVIDDNGYQHLEEVGKRDLQAEIDSYKETCLDMILDKYLNDDFSLKLGTPNYDPDDDDLLDLDQDDIFDIATAQADILDDLEGVDLSNLNRTEIVDKKEEVSDEKETIKEEKL